MRALFSILEARFKADPVMTRVGRKLYEGFVGERLKATLPYVEVTFGNTEVLDTFGAEYEGLETEFTVNTKGPRVDSADAIMDSLRRVYKGKAGESDELHLEVLRLIGTDGPSVEDGVYRASMSFVAWIQRRVLLPAT